MIYTKTGDSGTTSLVGGSCVDKDNPRVEAYGTVDELNSHIGLLAELIRHQALAPLSSHVPLLKTIQVNLFNIQTLLATEDETVYVSLPQLGDGEVASLEHSIDTLTDSLPKLKNFVIAGGNVMGAQAHVARTVCRRAERRVVSLNRQSPVDPLILRYLNRLSDYLFVLSRFAVVTDGKAEDLYINR